MAKEVEKRIESLRKKIIEYSDSYYKLAKSTISDPEFDRLFKELEKLEQENPHLITHDSPTQVIGSDLKDDSKLIKHKDPMLSIENKQDLRIFNKTITKKLHNEGIFNYEFIVEPKIDGVSVSLEYKNGKLITAATRGDGFYGEDITENVKTIMSIPKEINRNSSTSYILNDIVVRGEIFMYIRDFENLQKQQEDRDERVFANPRNTVAGIIKKKDSKSVANIPLKIFAYSLLTTEYQLKTQEENLEILRKLGFDVNSYIKKCRDIKEVITACEELEEIRDDLPYEIDGAVIKINSVDQREILGIGNKYPNWAVAFKFKPPQASSIILGIVWQVGRTGVITPVAELEPVFLAGSTISRATLHNYDEIEREDFRIGDKVIIEKGGDVIPKVVSVVLSERKKGSRKTKPPETCPSCNALLFKAEDEVAYYCQNLECPAQLKSKLKHFVSRNALDINAIAESVTEKLIDTNLVESPLDLFKLDTNTLSVLNLGTSSKPRVLGKKNAIKAVQAIQKAKTKPLAKWLFAIGIPKLGQIGAQTIAKKHETFQDVINSLILCDIIILQELTEKALFINPRSHKNPVESEQEKEERTTEYNQICDKVDEVGKRLVKAGWYKQNERKSKTSKNRTIPEYVLKNNEGIGAETAKSVLNFLNSNIGAEILDRLKNLEIHPVGEIEKKGKLDGKKFVLTGTLPILKRSEATELITQNGGKVLGTVSKNTSYLVAGDNPGSKFEEAKKLGIEIISEEQLLVMIK